MQRKLPAEPWRSFLGELDRRLKAGTELHCIGGFAAVEMYGLARSTADLAVVSVVPNSSTGILLELAGKGSTLQVEYGVYVDVVTVAIVPEDYRSRLQPMFSHAWSNLRLFSLEAHDLALSKLERNFERDRADVRHLAQGGYLNAAVLRQRYREELRPNLLSRHSWHDQTLEMWINSYLKVD